MCLLSIIKDKIKKKLNGESCQCYYMYNDEQKSHSYLICSVK